MVNFTDVEENRAYSWHGAIQLAHKKGPGEKIELPKRWAGPLPLRFEESARSIKGRANVVYRDQQEIDSVQAREYDEKWVLEVDHHNPETGNAVAHVIEDAPEYALGAAIVLGLLGAALSG